MAYKKLSLEQIKVLSVVLESIIELENHFGILLMKNELIKRISKNLKKLKMKLSSKEIKEILADLVEANILFSPRNDFLEKVSSYEEFSKSKNNL